MLDQDQPKSHGMTTVFKDYGTSYDAHEKNFKCISNFLEDAIHRWVYFVQKGDQTMIEPREGRGSLNTPLEPTMNFYV